jgi:hypothetical protein
VVAEDDGGPSGLEVEQVLLALHINVPPDDGGTEVVEGAGDIKVNVEALANEGEDDGLERRDEADEGEHGAVHGHAQLVLDGAHDVCDVEGDVVDARRSCDAGCWWCGMSVVVRGS